MRKRPLVEANRLSKLWQDFGPNTYPLDLKWLVEELVNKSSDGHQLDLDERPFDSIDGALVGEGFRWVATVNSKIRHRGRKNFTLAHEIGHFCCHRLLQPRFDCSRAMIDDQLNEDLEGEANQFASQLLMPPNKVRPILDGQKFDAVLLDEMTSQFGVSLSAAGLKCVSLSSRQSAFVVARDGFVCWSKSSDKASKCGAWFISGSELPEELRRRDLPGWLGVFSNKYGVETDFSASAYFSDRTGFDLICLDLGS